MTDCGRWIKTEDLEHTRKICNTISKPIIVELDGRSEALFPHRADPTGVGDGWIPRTMLEDFHGCGHLSSTLITRCDRETQVTCLQTDLGRRRAGTTLPTNSAVGDSTGNGRVDKAVHRFRNHLRRTLAHLQATSDYVVTVDHRIVDLMADWAAALVSRYVKGSCGRRARGRLLGTRRTGALQTSGRRSSLLRRLDLTLFAVN